MEKQGGDYSLRVKKMSRRSGNRGIRREYDKITEKRKQTDRQMDSQIDGQMNEWTGGQS